MSRHHVLLALLAVAAATPAVAQVRGTQARSTQLSGTQTGAWSGGVSLGYNSGKSFDFHLTTPAFGRHLPLKARFAFRYAGVDPGDGLLARHVFINDNTNGTLEQSGTTWGFKLDVLHPVHLFANHASVYAGVRHAWFTGDYRFVGGNEDFEIKSNHWGFGGGLETEYPVGRRVTLLLTGGLDYFLPSSMYGHDATYRPDNNNTNPRNDYNYSDADKAVGQPKFAPIMMVGMDYRF